MRTGTTFGKRAGRGVVSLLGEGLIPLDPIPIIAMAIGWGPEIILLPWRPSLRVFNSGEGLKVDAARRPESGSADIRAMSGRALRPKSHT